MSIAETNNKISETITEMVKTRADINLSNLTSKGNERLLGDAEPQVFEAQKGFITSNVLTDPHGYSELCKNVRSTFDISKFEIVGSPNITEDGLVRSLTPGANGVRVPLWDVTKSWSVEEEYIWDVTETNQGNNGMVLGHASLSAHNGTPVYFYVDPFKKQGFTCVGFVYKDGDTYKKKDNCIYLATTPGEVLKFRMSYDANTHVSTQQIFSNGVLKKQATYDHTSAPLIVREAGALINTLGSSGATDLKTLRITVDGKEFFNGAKTGMDVIKPDNYTVVGSPEISEDGWVTGNKVHGEDNYVQIPSWDTSKKWRFECSYIQKDPTPPAATGYNNYPVAPYVLNGVCVSYKGGTLDIYSIEDKVFYNRIFLSDNNPIRVDNGKVPAPKIGSTVHVVTEYDGNSTYTNTMVVNGNTYTNKVTSELKAREGGCIVGACWHADNDLNSVKVYVDGKLVYQPCLKIPYTLTKTGSKVVPGYARGRVEQVYEETGEALYWTLDEENENYTLPKGEIYGMVKETRNEVDDKIGYNHISNCLIETPHMVDLELKDGVLTLKAGSKVIIPYGTEAPTMSIGNSLNGGTIVDISWDGSKLFYIVETLEDKICSLTKWSAGSGFAFLDQHIDSGFRSIPSDRVYSGGTHTATAMTELWYDTSENIVKFTVTQGETWYNYSPLPIAGVAWLENTTDLSTNLYSRIDRVFQHVGHCGTVFWAAKGIKYLYPNGRNDKGVISTKVETQHVNLLPSRYPYTGHQNTALLTLDGYMIWAYDGRYVVSSDRPSAHCTWYNPVYNTVLALTEGGNITAGNNGVPLLTLRTRGSAEGDDSLYRVRLLRAHEAFQPANLNDLRSGVIPTIVETYSSGTSWYRIWSDGWCEQGGTTSVATVTFLVPFIDTNYTLNFGQSGWGASAKVGRRTWTSKSPESFTGDVGTDTDWVARGYIRWEN